MIYTYIYRYSEIKKQTIKCIYVGMHFLKYANSYVYIYIYMHIYIYARYP